MIKTNLSDFHREVRRKLASPSHRQALVPNNEKITQTDILIIRESSRHLKHNEKSIYWLISKRKVPNFKVRGAWYFRKGEIDIWLEEQNIANKQEGDQ